MKLVSDEEDVDKDSVNSDSVVIKKKDKKLVFLSRSVL